MGNISLLLSRNCLNTSQLLLFPVLFIAGQYIRWASCLPDFTPKQGLANCCPPCNLNISIWVGVRVRVRYSSLAHSAYPAGSLRAAQAQGHRIFCSAAQAELLSSDHRAPLDNTEHSLLLVSKL